MIETDSIKYGLSQKQFQQIEKVIASFCEIEKVLIFGSRATRKYKPFSDIDLAIFGKKLNDTIINRLSSDLDSLPLPFTFDVLNYNLLKNINLKNKIDNQGKIFFERQLNIIKS